MKPHVGSATPACVSIAALLPLFVVFMSAAAQDVRSTTRGLLVGVNFNGSTLKVEEGDRESGGGGGVTVGWGVSRLVTIFLRGDVAKIDITDPEVEGSYSSAVGDIGVRLSFREPADRFIPFIVAALSGQRATAEIVFTPTVSSDIEISGPGFTLGGGFGYFFSPQLALDVSVLLTSGRFTEVKVGTVTAEIRDLDSQAARFDIGLAWYPIPPSRP